MIITCSQCTTRFQLDETRIPEEGVKVRCSRCKHAFFVKRPELEDASDQSAAESLAREAREEPAAVGGDGGAATGSAAAAPGREREGGPGTADEGEERTALLGRMGDLQREDAGDEESDWQFNEDPEEGAPPVAAHSSTAAPASTDDPMSELFDAGEEPEDHSLEGLGRPEEWDLLGDDAEAERGPAEAFGTAERLDEEDTAPAAASVAPARDRDPAEPAQEVPGAISRGPGPEETALELGPGEPSQSVWRHAGSRLAWAAVGLLTLWIAGASILGVGIRTPARPSSAMVGGLRAEGVEARFVENATAGFLLLVRATLRNPGDSPRLAEGSLRIELLDAAGEILAAAPVARRIPESELRLGELAALQSRLRAGGEELAWTPFAPGEALEVAALFPDLPDDARAFRFQVATQAVAESGVGAAAAIDR